MKRKTAMILALVLVPVIYCAALDNRSSRDNSGNSTGMQAKNDSRGGEKENIKDITHQPVIIEMNHPPSGASDISFPSQHIKYPPKQQANNVPYYGRLQWTPKSPARQWLLNLSWNQKTKGGGNTAVNKAAMNQKPAVKAGGINSAPVVHHHPYEVNYIRKKLQNIGVVSEPGYITNREEVIHTDRQHSIITHPKEGFDKRPLKSAAVSYRDFNDKAFRSHMAMVDGIAWREKISGFNTSEILQNYYYWHNGGNFSYCHYIDGSGYHWYGWYLGSRYIWTRNFSNRWWFYDGDYDRWCFWNDGFWWWQDPYHIGDLYCYNNANYIPVNSADDNVAVIVPDNGDMQVYISPDKTRIVKVAPGTQDAFMYDGENPMVFNPVYLASGVKEVKFSETKNGRPLEIILVLNDGSYDMFDSYGTPYNPGSSEDNGSN